MRRKKMAGWLLALAVACTGVLPLHASPMLAVAEAGETGTGGMADVEITDRTAGVNPVAAFLAPFDKDAAGPGIWAVGFKEEASDAKTAIEKIRDVSNAGADYKLHVQGNKNVFYIQTQGIPEGAEVLAMVFTEETDSRKAGELIETSDATEADPTLCFDCSDAGPGGYTLKMWADADGTKGFREGRIPKEDGKALEPDVAVALTLGDGSAIGAEGLQVIAASLITEEDQSGDDDPDDGNQQGENNPGGGTQGGGNVSGNDTTKEQPEDGTSSDPPGSGDEDGKQQSGEKTAADGPDGSGKDTADVATPPAISYEDKGSASSDGDGPAHSDAAPLPSDDASTDRGGTSSGGGASRDGFNNGGPSSGTSGTLVTVPAGGGTYLGAGNTASPASRVSSSGDSKSGIQTDGSLGAGDPQVHISADKKTVTISSTSPDGTKKERTMTTEGNRRTEMTTVTDADSVKKLSATVTIIDKGVTFVFSGTSGNTRLKLVSADAGDAVGVAIPSYVTAGDKSYRVTRIASNGFTGNPGVEHVVIGKNIRVIGSGAFEGCESLAKVTCNGPVLINREAFLYCGQLKSIIFKGNVGRAGKRAFKGIHKKAVFTVMDASDKRFQKITGRVKAAEAPKTAGYKNKKTKRAEL